MGLLEVVMASVILGLIMYAFLYWLKSATRANNFISQTGSFNDQINGVRLILSNPTVCNCNFRPPTPYTFSVATPQPIPIPLLGIYDGLCRLTSPVLQTAPGGGGGISVQTIQLQNFAIIDNTHAMAQLHIEALPQQSSKQGRYVKDLYIGLATTTSGPTATISGCNIPL
jgi:hypothetical protein